MTPTPKPIHRKNRKGFLIKNLAHLANGIGQTFQVFYPVFCIATQSIFLSNHRVMKLTPHLVVLGYFIISMLDFNAPYIALMGAR